jgi:hypothetical protein
MFDEQRRRFYVVWGEGTGEPTVKHQFIEDARTQAERLAKKNPGEHFYVLVADSGYEYSNVRTIHYH